MTRKTTRRCLQLLSAGAVSALAFTPTFGQTTTEPGTSPGNPQSTPGESPRTGPDTMGRDVQRPTEGKQASSTQIRRAQEVLKSEGHNPGPIDGVMGPKTQEALRQFQRQENLQETGRLDRQTAEKLGLEQVSSQR
jgi:peptidoglycan hydrolase-like protein with peptidoglycan-binding domain